MFKKKVPEAIIREKTTWNSLRQYGIRVEKRKGPKTTEYLVKSAGTDTGVYGSISINENRIDNVIEMLSMLRKGE